MNKTRTKKLLSFVLTMVCLALVFMTMTVYAVTYLSDDSSDVDETPALSIGTKDELVAFANRVNSGETFEGKLVVLTADIDLENMAWTPIGYDSYGTAPENAVSFNGTFDGCGHTISNLTDKGYIPSIITNGEYGFGLFGYAYGASFKNINLENVNVYADGLEEGDGAGVAALVGYYRVKNGSSFVFENCHLKSGEIYATNNMGGLVGYMYAYASSADNYVFNLDGRFVNCTNAATVTTKMREAGGIVGLVDFTNGYNSGLKVYGDLLFEDCKNYGDITANNGANNSCAGGILGRDNTGSLWYFGGRIVFDSCYNSGTITAYGRPGSDEIHSGGMGTVYNVGGMTAALKNCVNEGVVQASGCDKIFCGEMLAFSGYAMIEHCTVTDYSKLYGRISRMLFVEQPGVQINENAAALLYLNGAAAPKILTFGQKGGDAEENIVARENHIFDGWYSNPEFTGERETFNNGGNDSGIFYAKFIHIEEAFENVEEGGTLTFEANVTGAGFIVGKDITIDLNGFTYDISASSATYSLRSGSAVQNLLILPDTNVTIKNGTIRSDEASTLIESYANLTLENVIIEATNLRGEKQALSAVAGTVVLAETTIVAAADGVAINVSDTDLHGSATVTLENSEIDGKIALTDENGGEFAGKLVSGEEEVTKAGAYKQYEEAIFFYMDEYEFSITVDRNALKATETLNAVVSVDRAYYSAEYTFTYDATKFSCDADLDGDGIIYVTNLYRGEAGDLATYTLVALNDIESVSKGNLLTVDGNVLQYMEQVVNELENTVYGDSESIKISLNYTAEIVADYVQGYSLVLVDGEDAGYAYNGVKMFYVEYYGAYAIIIEGEVTAEMVDEALAKTTDCAILTQTYDVNSAYVADGKVDLKDATAIYACTQIDLDVATYMDLYLLADVNGDRVVDMVDINFVTNNYN